MTEFGTYMAILALIVSVLFVAVFVLERVYG
jgi:hypothetical protein